MVEALFIIRAAIAAALTSACTARTETDVARAMCEKNILCANFYEPLEDCTARVAATMPPASCSASDLEVCEEAINDEACRAPEAPLPSDCEPCE
jgi:hypothetical protein